MSDFEVKTDLYDNISEIYPGKLHVNDRIYIKRLLSKQDINIEESVKRAFDDKWKKEIVDEVSESLAAVIIDQNKLMFEVLDKQNEAIAGIRKIVDEIKADNAQMKKDLVCNARDIEELKKYASKRNTFIRMAIVFIAALAAFLGIHKYWL
jgi:hypothetical protein